jgi:hypothetical protein
MSEMGKEEGIREKVFTYGRRHETTVRLYKGEVTLSEIHPLWQRACKANDTRNETDLRTKHRKHLIKGTSKEISPPNKTRGMENQCFFSWGGGGGWMLVNTYTHRRKKITEFKKQNYNGTRFAIMKDLSVVEYN